MSCEIRKARAHARMKGGGGGGGGEKQIRREGQKAG